MMNMQRILPLLFLLSLLLGGTALAEEKSPEVAPAANATDQVQQKYETSRDTGETIAPVTDRVATASPMSTEQEYATNAAGANLPYDMPDSVRRALKLNPELQAARYNLDASEYGRKSARGAFGPSLSLQYGYTFNDRKQLPYNSKDLWQFNVNVTQPIFTGFNLLSTYQKAALAQDQATAQLYNAELSLIQTVQVQFLQLLRARMNVKSAQDSVTRLESQLKVTQAFYDVGLKPKFDVLQAEVDYATSKQELLIALNQVDTQIARLNTLIELPLENDTDYTGELRKIPFSLSLDQCLASAYKNRPDLDIARKSVEIAQKDVKIAASDFYPQVSASWNYYKRGEGADVNGSDDYAISDTWSVGAAAQWNVFNWGQTYYGTRQAQEGVARLQSLLANTRLNASFEVKSFILALQEAADRINVAEKSVAAAREGYRMSVARYQAQVGTNTEVLDAQSRQTRSEFELAAALADYQIALAQLYVSMGQKNLTLEEH